LGNSAPWKSREQQAEQRRPEDHAGDHLAHHLGLAEDLLAEPADDAAGEQDHGELEEEVNAEIAGRVARGGRAVRAQYAGHRADEAGYDVGQSVPPW
jgi:hypothetical protein